MLCKMQREKFESQKLEEKKKHTHIEIEVVAFFILTFLSQ